MERYTVHITDQAQAHIEEIVQYITYVLHAPEAAYRLMEVLMAEIASLSRFPARIALTEDEPWHSRGIRKMSVKNYLVYFQIEGKHVYVTSIIYARRDQRQHLM